MPQIPGNVAQIVAVFAECTFYGIHLITFAATIHSIASSRPEIPWTTRFKRRRFTLMIVSLILALSSLNLFMGLVRTVLFITHDCIGIGTGADEQLGQDWINILKIICFQLQTDIADLILIYRCWVVCNKSLRIVILPIIFYMGLATSSIMIIVAELKIQGGKTARLNGNEQLLRLAIGFWVSTICLNVYASSVIVLRIWRIESKSRGKNTLTPLYTSVTPRLSRLQTAMKAIIESGLIYTTSSIVTFLTHITGSNSVYITTSMGIQIVGIAFNLVVIRVNQRGRSGTTVTGNAGSAAIEFAPGVTMASNSGSGSTEQFGLDSKVMQIMGHNSQAGVVGNNTSKKVTLDN